MSYIRVSLGALFALMLLMFPETALNAARHAMWVWVSSVAPALFPFILLMPLLTAPQSVIVYERLLGRLMRPLLNLPGAAAPAIVVGMVAGSPAGALAAARIASSAGLTQGQLERLVLCICGLSPAFLISGVGASMLSSAADGRILLTSQIAAQLVLLLATRAHRGSPDRVPTIIQDPSANPVSAAILNVLGVCGYMIAFNIAASILALASPAVGLAAAVLLDLPTGAAAIAKLSLNREAKLLLIAAMTGFGGLCIAAQNLSAVKKYGVRPAIYMTARLAAALLLPAITAMQLKIRIPVREKQANPMAISALAAVFLIVPIWFFLSKNLFLNKRKFESHREFLPKNDEKPQHMVAENGNEINILNFKKV